MWVIPVFCKNGSMEPKFTFATLGGDNARILAHFRIPALT